MNDNIVFAVRVAVVSMSVGRERESMWFPEVQERRSQVQCNSIIRGSASLPKSPATSPLCCARGGEGSAGSLFEAPDSGADRWLIGGWDALMHGALSVLYIIHSVYISDSIRIHFSPIDTTSQTDQMEPFSCPLFVSY